MLVIKAIVYIPCYKLGGLKKNLINNEKINDTT